MKRTFPLVTLAAMLAIGTPTMLSAQTAVTPAQWRLPGGRADSQRTYDDAYRSGMREGERDARSGQRPDYRQHEEFRRGSSGGGWGWGNSRRDDADVFRRGFAEGYEAGYDRYRGGGSYGRPGYPGGGYRPEAGNGYPGEGYGYPGSGYGRSPAAQRGFEDGYNDGREDARDNDRYEPTRKKDYRDGDEGYSSRYGSRDQYKREYRQAFQQGYDRGYREGRYR